MATPPDFTAGSVLTAAQMNAVGLWLVKTQTVGTAVSSQNVTACFSSDYANYMIAWSGIDTTADSYLGIKLLVSTTVNASNWQGNTFYVGSGAAGGLTNANVTASAYGEIGNVTNTYTNAGMCQLQAPQLASYSHVQAYATDNSYFRLASYVLLNNTQYDGVQLFPGSGTMTGGTIRVYGYKN